MDNLSLEDLFTSLQTAQEKKSTVHLSERNIVELVVKLRQLELLKEELLYTISGREYLTFQQLKKEIRLVLEQNGGRIALVDLPALLNVDLVHCERAAKEVVQQSNGDLILAQQEILSTVYFNSLAAEVDDMLQEVGAISIGDLARQFLLNTDMITSTLSSRLGETIKGRIEAGVVYTDGYVRRVKAQLRGSLRAAMEPVGVSDVMLSAAGEGMAGGAIPVAMLRVLVDELCAEGSINGTLRGGAMWTPAAYVAAQRQSVAEFYSTNGYSSYSVLSGMGISAPAEYLQGKFPEGTALESAFVSPSLHQQVESCVEEGMLNEGWCDIFCVLPPALGGGDAAAILQKITSPGQLVLCGSCVMSTGLIEDIKEKLLVVGREAADATAKKRHGKGDVQESTSSQPSTAAGGNAGAACVVDDGDDDWGRGGKKGKKSKKKPPSGGKGGSKGGAKAVGPPVAEDTGSTVNALTVDSIVQLILQWYPDMEGAGEDGGLAASIAELLRPEAVREYERCLHAVFTSNAETRKRRCAMAAAQVEQNFQRYQMYLHGLEALPVDEATQAVLSRHLIRSVGSTMLQWLLRYMEASLSDGCDVGTDISWEEAAALPMTPADQSSIMKSLPADVSRALQTLTHALTGGEPSEVQSAVESAASCMGMQAKVLDKKSERQLLASHHAALLQSLDEEQSPTQALALVLPLMVMQAYHKAISIPGRAIAGVLTTLQAKLPEDVFCLAQQYHQLVVEQLKTIGQTAGANQEVEQQLHDMLPKLKASVMGGQP